MLLSVTTPASSVCVANEKQHGNVLYVSRQRDETLRLSVDKNPTAIGVNQNPYTTLARALRPVTARRITDNILNSRCCDVRYSCFSRTVAATICHRSDGRNEQLRSTSINTDRRTHWRRRGTAATTERLEIEIRQDIAEIVNYVTPTAGCLFWYGQPRNYTVNETQGMSRFTVVP